jgi:hypothetical protein
MPEVTRLKHGERLVALALTRPPYLCTCNTSTRIRVHTHDQTDLCLQRNSHQLTFCDDVFIYSKEGYLLNAATCPSCHSFGRSAQKIGS